MQVALYAAGKAINMMKHKDVVKALAGTKFSENHVTTFLKLYGYKNIEFIEMFKIAPEFFNYMYLCDTLCADGQDNKHYLQRFFQNKSLENSVLALPVYRRWKYNLDNLNDVPEKVKEKFVGIYKKSFNQFISALKEVEQCQ